MAPLLIYGATGYTGRLICAQARNLGLDFAICGRSTQKLMLLAADLGVSHTTFTPDAIDVDAHIRSSNVLLNCAGPFEHTARHLMEACIRCEVHYLDVSAELKSYSAAQALDDAARDAGVMLLPGCGGSVAMLGCLAAHALKDATKPTRIEIAMHVAGPMSRGSAISAATTVAAAEGPSRLSDGQIVAQDPAKMVDFDFADGRGAVSCFPVTLPDLLTLRESTGCKHIETFVNVSGDAFPSGPVEALPDGPSCEEREKNPYHAAVRVYDGRNGGGKKATLLTVNGYTYTAIASADAARRVLSGEVMAGWQTPAGLFGELFIDAVPGTAFVN